LNAGWNKLEDPVADEQPAPIRSKRRRVRGVVLTGQLLVGKYRVARVVSVNGVTALVEVRHREVRQHMLLKYLLPAACAYPDAVARFLRGARAALRINSEHAVRVTDVGRLESGAP